MEIFQLVIHKLEQFIEHGGGLSPTLCAGTHGYALGYIVVNKKKVSKKQIKYRRNEL